MLRQAVAADVPAIHRVRMSVRENRLVSTVITEADTRRAIEELGRGWVVEVDGQVVAFAVGNVTTGNIWALFVDPSHERKGYGRRLHDEMINWLWAQGLKHLWLTTEPGTRAEHFYEAAGWKNVGKTERGEVRFEMLSPNNALDSDAPASLRSIGALMAFLVLSAAAHGQPFPEPRAVRINDRVHVLLGPVQHANRHNQGYMINSTVIVGDHGVILVDSGGTAEVGRHIAAAVRRITDKPVTHVVNTHHHGDHYLGNVAFQGATFISSEICRQMVLETGADWLRIMERDIGRPLPGTKPIAAGITYAEGTRTETFVHGVRFVFWVPRGSHTAGDLLVHLPDDKVLIAGDVLVNRVVPTLQDGFLKNWIRTLEDVHALEVAHFVPGHGDLMTRDDVAALRNTMLRFHAGVRQGFRSGQSEEKIRKSLDLSMWDKLERSYVIGRNVNRAYLEVEADSFDE